MTREGEIRELELGENVNVSVQEVSGIPAFVASPETAVEFIERIQPLPSESNGIVLVAALRTDSPIQGYATLAWAKNFDSPPENAMTLERLKSGNWTGNLEHLIQPCLVTGHVSILFSALNCAISDGPVYVSQNSDIETYFWTA